MLTSNEFSCLVVEDEAPKLAAVVAALSDIDEQMKIHTAGSVASALEIIASELIDFAVIDMSLPAYDFAKDLSGGGQPQDSGGRDILRFLEDERPNAKALILTMYQEFNLDNTYGAPQKLAKLSADLSEEFPKLLVDVIYYSGQRGIWKEKLKSIVSMVKGNKE